MAPARSEARYAALVAATFDAHNAGRIEAEPRAGEPLRGTTELHDALAPPVA